MLLEELIAEWLADHDRGAVEIVGGPGSGKSTALAHLAAVLCPGRAVLYLDQPIAGAVDDAAVLQPVIYTTTNKLPDVADIRFRLESWDEDALIEYLLTAHPDQCRSVMARIRDRPERHDLDGIPELWRIVLDRMAQDESARDLRAVLRSELAERLTDPDHRHFAQSRALAHLRGGRELQLHYLGKPTPGRLDPRAERLVRHRVFEVALATDRLIDSLEKRRRGPFDRLPAELVRETALMVRDSPAAMNELHAMLTDAMRERQATAASILHATATGWTPTGPLLPSLKGAFLDGARWPGIDLSGATLSNADLTRADLTGAVLAKAVAREARLLRVSLREANLSDFVAGNADLKLADLRGCVAPGAVFRRADLRRANLGKGIFDRANFREADLRGAQLRAACLTKADLTDSKIEEADFSHADLREALLAGVVLRTANFAGANFQKACLVRSDLESMRLPDANFMEADLIHALLTGSFMPRANFQRAVLRGAGLADVDWEDADLRDADLRESSFFLGSSRSGLVGSPLACEGSRTGFYTDDFDEQTFKAPEEIRKANLRGADLRGANITGVDFYLVDLRDAKYSPEQAEQLRASGAILFARAAG